MIPAADTAGRISAVQTFGTLDGPGIRFVAFLQGCPLRCACCHNPETWDPSGGKPTTAAALSAKNAAENAGCSSGSPPERVTPPPDCS